MLALPVLLLRGTKTPNFYLGNLVLKWRNRLSTLLQKLTFVCLDKHETTRFLPPKIPNSRIHSSRRIQLVHILLLISSKPMFNLYHGSNSPSKERITLACAAFAREGEPRRARHFLCGFLTWTHYL
jgi:hypothetical protein